MQKELYSTQVYKDALAFALKAHGVHTLNTKDLLYLNKQVDEKIVKYMSTIYEGEAVVCKNFSKS